VVARIVGAFLALALLASCAGDPLDVANCTELAVAAAELLEAPDTDPAQLEAITSRAVDLAGEARARGADLEADLCVAIAGAANAELFELVAAELDNAGD
jgi:hypothetical protein